MSTFRIGYRPELLDVNAKQVMGKKGTPARLPSKPHPDDAAKRGFQGTLVVSHCGSNEMLLAMIRLTHDCDTVERDLAQLNVFIGGQEDYFRDNMLGYLDIRVPRMIRQYGRVAKFEQMGSVARKTIFCKTFYQFPLAICLEAFGHVHLAYPFETV
ncbi:hypothetical protein BAUCODRAFT_228802 [Baudoinia panamericana UAMH 10762]|uniref:Uncharacterized protein n=1 Tax=Baudoinia panamericana (strain UAMH 10762) TaxID=717646 RepID=M2M9L9_BAUPA|nr:uncharacterized protein BAUCODRAFT_228802 [Baudoinia panamericana UAMH 10762]EMC93116.1 hypothetical protein BAUCODRAFT_228802 [Baudoinia panamericana UAMH 10762]